MKVYIVHGVWDYDGSEIVGAFTTREKADAGIADDQLTSGQEIQGEWYPRFDSYSVIMEEVQ